MNRYKTMIVCLLFFISMMENGNAQCTFDAPITVVNSVTNDIYCPNDSVILTTDEFDSYQWFYNFSSNTNVGGTPFPNGNTQTISVPASQFALGYFYVSATKDNCTEPSPTFFWDSWVFAPIGIQSSGQSTVCSNSSTIISNAFPGPSIFQWFKDGLAIPGATSSEYEVTESGTYTLEGAYEICPTYFISSGVGPTFNFIDPIIPEITQNGNVLTASSGSNFQWLLNGVPIQSANDATLLIPTEGDFSVSVTDANGCVVTSEIFTVMTLSTEKLEALSIEISPNPATDIFQIKNNDNQKLDVRIINLQGRKLFYEKNISDEVVNIPTEDWSPGIYIINISSEDKNVAYKLMKN